MVFLGNEQEIILSYLILHPSTAFRTLVDYDGYSISSKGFLPTSQTTLSEAVISPIFSLKGPFIFPNNPVPSLKRLHPHSPFPIKVISKPEF